MGVQFQLTELKITSYTALVEMSVPRRQSPSLSPSLLIGGPYSNGFVWPTLWLLQRPPWLLRAQLCTKLVRTVRWHRFPGPLCVWVGLIMHFGWLAYQNLPSIRMSIHFLHFMHGPNWLGGDSRITIALRQICWRSELSTAQSVQGMNYKKKKKLELVTLVVLSL